MIPIFDPLVFTDGLVHTIMPQSPIQERILELLGWSNMSLKKPIVDQSQEETYLLTYNMHVSFWNLIQMSCFSCLEARKVMFLEE